MRHSEEVRLLSFTEGAVRYRDMFSFPDVFDVCHECGREFNTEYFDIWRSKKKPSHSFCCEECLDEWTTEQEEDTHD